MNKINLFWYKHKDGHGNFGDALNPYIVEKISNAKVRFVNIHYFGYSRFFFVKSISAALLNGEMKINEYFMNLYFYFLNRPKVLIAIGSVLQTIKSSNAIVWGSGIIASDNYFANADFRAVRGKFSQKRLRELGYHVPNVIGDPAILLPLIYQAKKKEKKYKMGLIPHFIHFENFQKYGSDDILIINLLDPIEKILEEINSCEITLSTSLHGIIVSHAYGIPSIWCSDQTLKLWGDDIKFSDYFSSVAIDVYKPIDVNNLSKSIDENFKIIHEIQQPSRIPSEEIIREIQLNLLNAFPYTLRESFEYLLEARS
ncbi:polysaccharide pyruvyl transferase family protein [Soonwooa sp.]|uniref:polysaccharide pyruvyl transferase family protein n=1 Tax=Soonwooa sp. TaxID=1938592 RepID=UPI0028A85F8C|nr:polysaccharide pyruvyl transferase family protein [Soonwooa sp.]